VNHSRDCRSLTSRQEGNFVKRGNPLVPFSQQTRSAHRCVSVEQQRGKMFSDSFNDRSGTARTKLVVLDGGSAYTPNSVSTRQTRRRKERAKERDEGAGRCTRVQARQSGCSGTTLSAETETPPASVLMRRSRGNSRRINSIRAASRVCHQPRYFMTQADRLT